MGAREDTKRVLKRTSEATLSTVRWLVLGWYLLVIFYLTISVAVMSLSAHQLLHKINSVEVNGEMVTTTLIREFVKDLETSEKPVAETKKRFDDHVKKTDAKLIEFDQRIENLKASFDGDFQSKKDELYVQTARNAAELEQRDKAITSRKVSIDADSVSAKAREIRELEAEYAALTEKFDQQKTRVRRLTTRLEAANEKTRADIAQSLEMETQARDEALALITQKAERLNNKKQAYQNDLALVDALNQDIALYEADRAKVMSARDETEISKILDSIRLIEIERERYRAVANCNSIKFSNAYNEQAEKHINRVNRTIARYGFAAQNRGLLDSAALQLSATSNERNVENAPPEDAVENDESSGDGGFKCDETYKDIELGNFTLVDPKVQGMVEDFGYFNTMYLSQENRGDNTKWYDRIKVWKWIDFTKMPVEYLTILLVLSMGLLGGTIRLTRIYLRYDDNENYANYLFFPIMGAVTALAVYVLAKAGVLIISDPGSSRAGTLSPYFISFIGLVSGMLADNALDTIQNLGGNWFKEPAQGPERWAIGLEERCNNVQETLSVHDMADLTGFLPETVQAWLDEVKPVPFSAQKLISARLNTPIRELFSDIPPRRMAADSMGSMEPHAPSN